jgi:hypothetical protein
MVNNNYFEKIVQTLHYKLFHKRDVPWGLVLRIVCTANRKPKGKNLIEFKTKNYYVLGKIEKNELKIINAKTIK